MVSKPRIASLLSSATEIVCALGLAECLVGISHECDYPPVILDRPVLTETKVDGRASSAQIDAQVKKKLEEGGGMYRVRGNLLRELAPDVIITQRQCEVCAVSYDDVLAATRDLGYPHEIVSLEPMRLEDVLQDILRVGEALRVTDRAERLVDDFRLRIERVRQRSRTAGGRPRTLCVEWIEPLMAAGNWIPEMIELAGGTNLFGVAGEHSPAIDWSAVVDAQPEVVIVAPCGFRIDQTIRDMAFFTRRTGWERLPAVRRSQFFVANGSDYFNRSGPRLVDTLEFLASMIHPELFEERSSASTYFQFSGER